LSEEQFEEAIYPMIIGLLLYFSLKPVQGFSRQVIIN